MMLAEKADEAGEKFDVLSLQVKQIENRMADIAALKTHIIKYSKTRDIYASYKVSAT